MDKANNQSYLVMARRHRPQKFGDLIGQDFLVQVLKNGLKNNQLGHAFLLTGIRGVGKTTVARLLAKSINCMNLNLETFDPCDSCASCQGILEDKSLDVIEFDAASKTGVDDIRDLVESVRYRPIISKFKIFIIDEVHMLSKGAFNALLKTLEEPPPHVKFIFATTELQKIPATILSRCLKFELKRLTPEVLKPYFLSLLAKDNIDVEEGALELICKAADGSARDGCSLLEQAVALGERKITFEHVKEMLGLVQKDSIEKLLDLFLEGHPKEGLDFLNELRTQGQFNPERLMQMLLEICHEKMIKAVHIASPKFPSLAQGWTILQKITQEIQYSPVVYESLSVGLMKLSYLHTIKSPEALLKLLDKKDKESKEVIALTPVDTENWRENPVIQMLLEQFPESNVELLEI